METQKNLQEDNQVQDETNKEKENPVLKIERMLLGVFEDTEFRYHWH